MVAFAAGVTAMLADAGIRPDYAAGLSLGEYSALECADVLDAKGAVELVAFRGQAMGQGVRGAGLRHDRRPDAGPRQAEGLL